MTGAGPQGETPFSPRRHFTLPAALGGRSSPGPARAAGRPRPAGPGGGTDRAGNGGAAPGAPFTSPALRLGFRARALSLLPVAAPNPNTGRFPIPLPRGAAPPRSRNTGRDPKHRTHPRAVRPRPFLRRPANGRAGRGLNGGDGRGPLVPLWAALRAQVGPGPAQRAPTAARWGPARRGRGSGGSRFRGRRARELPSPSSPPGCSHRCHHFIQLFKAVVFLCYGFLSSLRSPPPNPLLSLFLSWRHF